MHYWCSSENFGDSETSYHSIYVGCSWLIWKKNTGDYWSSEFYKGQIFWECQKKIEEISHFANEMGVKIIALASKVGQIKKMKAHYFVM